MNETIEFMGLGNLGLPVATNLLNAGYSLVVYNRTESKAEALVSRGAKLAAKPVELSLPEELLSVFCGMMNLWKV